MVLLVEQLVLFDGRFAVIDLMFRGCLRFDKPNMNVFAMMMRFLLLDDTVVVVFEREVVRVFAVNKIGDVLVDVVFPLTRAWCTVPECFRNKEEDQTSREPDCNGEDPGLMVRSLNSTISKQISSLEKTHQNTHLHPRL